MTRQERIYCLSVLLTTMVLTGLQLHQVGTTLSDPLYTLLLAAFALFASRLKVVIPRLPGNLSGGFLFTILAVFQISLVEALLVGAVAVVAQTKWNSRTPANLCRYVFNLSCVSASVVTTKLVFDTLRVLLPSEIALLNSIICGAVYFCVNTGVLSGMLAINQRRPFGPLWRETFFWSMPLFAIGAAAMCVLGVVGNVMGRASTMLVGPVLILIHRYHTMKVDTMEESHRRLEMANEHIQEMNEVHMRTIEALALAIGAKDEVTGSHLNRVRIYCRNMGVLMGLTEEERRALDAASLLHDIGKLAVPEHILTKPGRLTPEEFESIKLHPQIGAEILERVRFPYPVVPIVRSHHEQWAGAGYPDGLKGEEIPIGARILSVVDCFDALASDRQYRKAIAVDEVMRMIEADSGTRYDPTIVAHLKANYLQWEVEARQSVSNLNLMDVSPVSAKVVPGAGFSPEGNALSPSVVSAISSASSEVQMMLELSGIMVTSTSVPSLMQQMSPCLSAVIPFDGLSLYYTGGGQPERVFSYGTGEHPQAPNRERGAVESAVAAGQIVLLSSPGDEAAHGITEAQPFPAACALPLFGSAREMVGVLVLSSALPSAFTRDHVRILNTIATQVGMTVQLLRMFASVVSESRIDALTGVGNRRELDERLSSDVASSKRNGDAFSLLCVDIDNFKLINDQFGHAVGDEVLCRVADVLQDCRQPMDYVCRIGGDEFVLVLPGAERELASKYREDIENLLASQAEGLPYPGLTIQLSVGMASLSPEITNREQLLSAADADMYVIKRLRKSVESAA